MAANLKLTAQLNDQVSKGLDTIASKIRGLSDKVKAEGDKQAAANQATAKKIQAVAIKSDDTLKAFKDRHFRDLAAMQRRSVALEGQFEKQRTTLSSAEARQRIALQRSSISLHEKMEAKKAAASMAAGENSLRQTRSKEAAASKIERQAAIAQSALVVDRFDRRIAIERTRHTQSLALLKGNNAAQESEVRRHAATVQRIQMDKANLPNTPFQRLLGIIGRPQAAPVVNVASPSMPNISGNVAAGTGAALRGAGRELIAMAAPLAAATLGFGALTQGIRSSVQSANQMNSIRRGLDFAAGGARAGAKELEFLRLEAKRLGFDMLSSAQGFTMLSAAARGTALEGKGARDIFTGVSEAAVSLGLSADQTSGALNAIQQMISKGSVQAEELRGQLGERLPGAFQMAARAMGVSTAKLGEMLKAGEVLSDDFLPKFAAELHKTFGASASKAAAEGRAEITRFNNSIKDSASVVGEALVQSYGLLAKAMNSVTLAQEGMTAAGNRYRMGVGVMYQPDAAPSKRDVDKDRIQAFAKAQDKMDSLRQGAEQKAGDQRLKDGEVEKKFRDESVQQAKDEAERVQKIEEDLYNTVTLSRFERNQKLRDLAAQAKADRLAGHEDELKTSQIYAQREIDTRRVMRDADIGSMRPGAGRQIEESKAREQDELAAFNLSQAARTMGFMQAEQVRNQIAKRFSDERKQLANDEALAIVQSAAGLAGSIGQLLQVAAGKNRTMAKAGMRLTQASAIASTAAGVAKAFEQTGIGGFIAGAAIAAAGAVQVGTIEKQINRFAQGTHNAPGGMSIVGEQGPEAVFLPRGSQVKTARETREMAMGGGPRIDVGGINITLTGTATQADANLVAEAVETRLKTFANSYTMAKDRGFLK